MFFPTTSGFCDQNKPYIIHMYLDQEISTKSISLLVIVAVNGIEKNYCPNVYLFVCLCLFFVYLFVFVVVTLILVFKGL